MVNRSCGAGLSLKISDYSSVQHFISPPIKPVTPFLGLGLNAVFDNRPNMGKCKTPPASFNTAPFNQDLGAYVALYRAGQQYRGVSPKAKSLDSSPSTVLAMPSPLYAGAKFSDPPAPTALPKPPSHWVKGTVLEITDCNKKSCGDNGRKNCAEEITHQLKLLLNVQA